MNVLVDATALASGHRWRGIGNYVRHLTSGLSQGFPDETRFLTLGDRPDGLPSGRLVPVAPRIPARWDDLWALYARRVSRAVLASRPAVYHFTSAEASLSTRNLRTMATVYDLIPLESRPKSVDPRNAWRRLLYRLYLRHLRQAHHLIAISRSTAESLTGRLGIPYERITVIPLGIDRSDYLDRARMRRDSIRSNYRLPAEYWLTVTSPNSNKGWPDLLQALSQLGRRSDAPLVIAGHWLHEHRSQLLSAAERLGVSSRIRFLGFVPDDDLPALYAEAVAFVFPSRREGFGLPVLEAMAVGTPVIVSDDPALMELVGAAALVFPRGDAAALADRMAGLASDKDQRSRLGLLAMERAAGFSWERTIEETVAIYRSLN